MASDIANVFMPSFSGMSKLNISSSPSISLLLLFSILASFLVWNLRSYLRLRHIPGPFLASLTNIPRLSWVYSNHAGDIHTELHRRYGPIVRFGPNMVSVSAPTEINTIYDIHGKFLKSDFYWVLSFYLKGKAIPGLFATQDRRIHNLLRKPIAGIYSMTSMVSYEPMVDSTITCFFEQLDRRFVQTQQTCPLDLWLQMFAFDVIGSITFSKRLGFLEQGRDIDNIIENSWKYFRLAAVKTQMPWLDYIWTKNPILQRLRTARVNPIVAFAAARRKERKALQPDSSSSASDEDIKTKNNKDFLTRFLEVESRDPATPPWAVSAWSTSNITAGSDTTAILLRTIIHNLLRHPSSLAKLRAELADDTTADTNTKHITWKQSLDLPYLHACIKEAGRLVSRLPSRTASRNPISARYWASKSSTKTTHQPVATIKSLGSGICRDKNPSIELRPSLSNPPPSPLCLQHNISRSPSILTY